jgi:hypothetical protein
MLTLSGNAIRYGSDHTRFILHRISEARIPVNLESKRSRYISRKEVLRDKVVIYLLRSSYGAVKGYIYRSLAKAIYLSHDRTGRAQRESLMAVGSGSVLLG